MEAGEGEDGRTLGKRKVDEADIDGQAEDDSDEEEAHHTRHVRRMRCSENADKSGGAGLAAGSNAADLDALPSDAASGPEAKAMQSHPKGGTAPGPVSGGTDNPNCESLFGDSVSTQSGELQIEAPRPPGNVRLSPAVEDPSDGIVHSADKDILDNMEFEDAIPIGGLGGSAQEQELDAGKFSDSEQEPAGMGLELAEEKGSVRWRVGEQDGSQSLMQASSEPMETGGTEAQNTEVKDPPCESFPNEEVAASPPVPSANPPQFSELLATPPGEEQDEIGADIGTAIGRDENAVAQASSSEDTGHCEQASEAGPSAAEPLQLFVKLFDGRTVLVRADSSISTEALLERLRYRTGFSCLGQRLLYNGRELRLEAPLATSALHSGCTLTLAARLPSSAFPWAFTLTERLLQYAKVALDPTEKIGRREIAANTVTHQVAALVETSGRMHSLGDLEWGWAKAGVVDVFRTMGGPKMLHALLQAPEEFCRRCAEDCIRCFITEVHISYIVKGRLGCHCLPILADVWAMLLSDDFGQMRDLYERVSSALLDTLASKSQPLIRAYFRFSKQEALEFFVGMLERVKDRLCTLPANQDDFYTIVRKPEGHTMVHGRLAPLPEAKAFGLLCHVVVSAMQAAADEIVHSTDAVALNRRGERQYTAADWAEGALWSRLGEVYAQIQKVLDPTFYDHVAGWWRATSAALFSTYRMALPEAANGELDPHQRDALLFQAVVSNKEVREPVNAALGGRMYHILDGLHEFNFGGGTSPFFARFESLLTGHELEIDALAFTCPDNKTWMFDEPARRHLAPRTRVAWFLKQFPEPEEGAERFEMMALRGPRFLTDTISMLDEDSHDLSKLQHGLGVVFHGEEAEGPGVLREWFTLVARELFSEEKGLFLAAPEDKRRVLPNPESETAVGEAHLEYMRLAGHVLGLSILHRFPLGVLLSTPFHKALSGQAITWPDARDISPDLYNSCQKIMDLPPGDVESLGLTFSADVVQNGAVDTMELVRHGLELAVTGENREDYLDRSVAFRLMNRAVPQIMRFYQGFSTVIAAGQSLERALNVVGRKELEGILESAAPDVDIADWKLHTEYSGYTPECDQVRWFWRAVEEMTSDQRRRLLYFATAVAHLPLSGFGGLPHTFRLHRAYVDEDWLPTAHTCFHLLMLPPYSSCEMMRSRLLVVTQDHIVEGFGFV